MDCGFEVSSLATQAQFFRIGLMTGVCSPDEVREWALSVIDKMDAPPGEIIEVSWRKPTERLLEDLDSIEGEANLALAVKCLLQRLLQSLPAANDTLDCAVRQALQVARSLDDMGLYDEFDRIDDGLQLAATGVYGTIAECREGFEAAIRAYLAQSS